MPGRDVRTIGMGRRPKRYKKDGENGGLGGDIRYGKVLGDIIDCGCMGGYIWRPQKKQNTLHNILGQDEQ